MSDEVENPDRPRRSLGSNYALNAAGTVVPMALGFIIVPLYISRIGADRYGILSIAWILLGYLGFLDFGLSRASANALSRLANAGPEERVPVLVTGFYLNVGLGLIGGLLILGGGLWWLGHMGRFSGSLQAEIASAMPWLACMLPLSMVAGVGTGAIESRERFLVSNLMSSVGGVLGQVVPICCAILIGPSLSVVIPAAFGARVVWTAAIWIYVVRSEHPVDPRRFDRSMVRKLLGYGAWVSVSSVISPILESFDQMLIGGLLGPAAIAHYNVPMTLASRVQFISTALAKTLFPRFSRVAREEAHHLAARATVTLAYGYGAVCAPAIVFIGPFLNLWLGRDFAAYAAPVAVILLVGGWTNGMGAIPFTLLQSQGRPDLTARIHACEVLPFLGGVWWLTTLFGLPGAAWAWTARVSLDLLVMLAVAGLLRTELKAIVPAVLITAMSWGIATFLQPSALPAFALACAIGLAMVASALIWDRESRSLALSLIRRARVHFAWI